MSIYNQYIKRHYIATERQLLLPSPQPRYTIQLDSVHHIEETEEEEEEEEEEEKESKIQPKEHIGVNQK
jgi:hypothetical protein